MSTCQTTSLIEVGAEADAKAEVSHANGDVAYAWEGDAPGMAEGDTFRIDTSRAGGPYTLTCTVTDEIGGEAQASMEFRIVHAEPLSIQLTGLGTGLIEVGAEAEAKAEVSHANGNVAYAWEGDAPGMAEGDTFRIDTSRAGGPYTLTCMVTDETGGEAQASVEFRILARYCIFIAVDIENGMLTADREKAEEGETVTLKAIPAGGYRLSTFLVDGKPIAGNTFTMPGHEVFVSAMFEEVLEYARLPFVGEDTPYSGPWGTDTADGLSVHGVGTYSDGSAKLDRSGSFLQIKFVGRPGVLRYGIKGNGTYDLRPSTFVVEESAYGDDWRELARYVLGKTLLDTRVDACHELSSDSRYVRFFYEERNAGNVGIYDVYISAGEGELRVGFDREEGFAVEMGEAEEITATAGNGRKPYSYAWRVDGEAVEGGEGGTLAIPATLGIGAHRMAVTATDADGDRAVAEIGFTVTELAPRHPVTVAGDLAHGTVSADKEEAKEGATVTLTATAADGYRFAGFLVDGKAIEGNAFTMPGTGVVVSAVFEKESGKVFRRIWTIGELEPGEYLLAGSDGYGTFAAVAQVAGDVGMLPIAAISPVDDAVASPVESLVWILSRRGEERWTIYNRAVGYLGYTGDINNIMAEAKASEQSTWTFSTVGDLFRVSNVGTPERTLRFNQNLGSQRFACYASNTLKNLSLYKRVTGGAIDGLAVAGGVLSFHAPGGDFTVQSSTNLLDAEAWIPVENPEIREGKVVLPIEGEFKIFRVVQ